MSAVAEATDRLTRADITSALQMIAAVADTIREVGSVPSGVLYAGLTGRMTLQTYNSMIATLKRCKLVEEKGFLLTWVGGTL